MDNKLTFEQALKLYNKEVISKNVIVKLDKRGINKRTEFFVHDINIDESNEKMSLKVISGEKDMMNKVNYFWTSYDTIINIADMPIKKILEAYDMSEENYLEEIDIETDVENDVNGKENAMIDGIELEEGMRFMFLNDKTPKYNNRIYTVKFKEGKIKLTANRGRPKKIAD